MPNMSRRQFSTLLGATAVTPLFAPRAIGQAKPKVVIIGGGPGGGTLARQIRRMLRARST